MTLARLRYRAQQFWDALWSAPAPGDLRLAERWLNPEQMRLFLRMQPGEQAHSLRVMNRLLQKGEAQPDLMAAALLHDVGKALSPLRIEERVLIVLVRTAAPQVALRWGSSEARGWRRAFVTAEQHPAWGAELALKAGTSALAVELIRRHQEPPLALPDKPVERMLACLQHADQQS
jgi:hypothetical protein